VVLSECLIVAIDSSLVPIECLSILPLLVGHQAHVVDGVEGGTVTLSEFLLTAIGGPLVAFRCLAILSLVVESRPMLLTVLRVEG
jgi:hypothetical protein